MALLATPSIHESGSDSTSPSAASAPADEMLAEDLYADDVRMGAVVGSQTKAGLLRQGVDVEGAIGIDHGALRIQPLVEPGWGRAALGYGPFRRENGVAGAVFMVNGHNTSQSENLPDDLRSRLWRWWIGSETYSARRRLVQWLRHSRKGRMIRRLRSWIRATGRPMPVLDENLAVGFLPGFS